MEIVLTNDDAIIPTRASKISAGLDLYSSIMLILILIQKKNKYWNKSVSSKKFLRFY